MDAKERKSDSRKSKKAKGEKEETRGTKRSADADKKESVEVRSANNWENADLGQDERKNKFLRLMGASKKEHHGRFVIGNSSTEHGRTKEETEKLTDDLEEQYQQGMGLVLSGAARQHKGLGFQESNEDDQDADTNKDWVKETQQTQPEKPEEEEKPKKKKAKDGSKDDKDKSDKDVNDASKADKSNGKSDSKPKLFGFVKSSS